MIEIFIHFPVMKFQNSFLANFPKKKKLLDLGNFFKNLEEKYFEIP